MPRLPMSPVRAGGKPERSSDEKIVLDGLSFEVRRSERRKTLEIAVDRAGELFIAAPSEAEDHHLEKFIEDKLLWIHTKIEQKARLQRRAPVKQFTEGEGFLYLGKSYRLRLLDCQLVDLALQNGRFCLRQASAHRGREIFIAWYTRKAQIWFDRQVRENAYRMGVNVTEVKVQDLGYRWASFGKGGRVSFHWKSVLVPPRIAQYIVVHELAHAFNPDHSAGFWAKVEQHLPDWRSRKDWLAENGMQVEGI